MTRIRSAMFALAIAAGAAATAGAQQVTTPQAGQRAEHAHGDSTKWGHREGRGKRGIGAHALLRGVNLTDAQKAQVKVINQKYRSQFEALRQQEAGEIRGVLTSDQQTTFDANLQQFKARLEKREQRGQGRARSGR